MGLLDGTTQVSYYQGNDHGNYQFVSLKDIISQFMIAYVGEEKIISKASRTDVAFHAQRGLAELSFDTLKSFKSQEIILPPSNTMILPHDYVSYTKLLWSDSAGIKHIIYPTSKTQNPFAIKQDNDGTYSFGGEIAKLTNGNFTNPTSTAWSLTSAKQVKSWDNVRASQTLFDHDSDPLTADVPKWYFERLNDSVSINSDKLEFKQLWFESGGSVASHAYGAYQHVDVSNLQLLDLIATATSGAKILDGSTLICDYGVIRVGITTTDPSVGWQGPPIYGCSDTQYNNLADCTGNNEIWDIVDYYIVTPTNTNPFHLKYPSPNYDASKLDLGYLEWSDGSGYEKEILDINVSDYDDVWVYIQSFSPWTEDSITTPTSTNAFDGTFTQIEPASATYTTHQTNDVESVFAGVEGDEDLLSANPDGNSTTWNKYKSSTTSTRDNINRYDDGTYDLVKGERYGLDPQHAQVNGSFYIDDLRGLIHFSSNLSGQTIVLDYISDSLGTDGEMQVHKFAEEAMYKWITYAVLSTRANTPEYIVRRYKKEKFAAIRQAKLRLSNIKLEELTQILRGKSKHIKH